jgi:hypothetical protein
MSASHTQLASWAELRHDTVLYAKQSYTTSLGCSYPDAYVEPCPEFFRALGDFAKKGKEAAAGFDKRSGQFYVAQAVARGRALRHRGTG